MAPFLLCYNTFMQYITPDYYSEFHCIGGACPLTCCAGWQIVIDEETLSLYEQAPGPLGDYIRKQVDWQNGTFYHTQGRCNCLREDGLCQIYKECQSEDYWSDTCRSYPRHTEEFEGVREISLGLSCPEAARIILSKKEPVTFLLTEDAEEEFYEDFDYLLYSQLIEARKILLSMAQHRSSSMATRCAWILRFGAQLQAAIDTNQLFFMDDIMETFTRGLDAMDWALFSAENTLPFPEVPLPDFYARCQSYEAILSQMEPLFPEYVTRGKTLFASLTALDRNAFFHSCNTFQEAFAQSLPDIEILFEQILVYFLFVYVCGAVYDDSLISKVRMAVLATESIFLLSMAAFFANGQSLSHETILRITVHFCRELEHSDENLDLVESYLDAD